MANTDDFEFDQYENEFINACAIDYDAMEVLHNASESEPSDTDEGTDREEWYDVTEFDSGPAYSIPIFNINRGSCLPSTFDVETAPIDYFCLFFNFIC